MRSYPSWIAGLKHRGRNGLDRASYCASLSEGTLLQLLREPDNQHDPNAVAIYHGGNHVGYVPARHGWVAKALEQRRELECEVVEVDLAGGLLKRRRAEHVETRITVVSNISREEAERIQERRNRKALEDKARKCCVDGLRVLAYLSLVDGKRSPEEHNVEISVIESRLIGQNFDRDPDILAMLAEQAAALSVSKSAMTRAVNSLAKDESYFRLVAEAAITIAKFDGECDPSEVEVISRLLSAGKKNGWIA